MPACTSRSSKPGPGRWTASLAAIRRTYEASAKTGRLAAAEVATRLDRLEGALDLQALADRDLVIEAVFEQMAVKTEVFAALDRIAKPGAILASNTSYLDIDTIAAATSRPDHVLGLHFFSPAHIMRLLEIVRGARTAPQVMATAQRLAKRLGKVAVVVGNSHGFVGNRMLAVRQREANALILEGAAPWDVDRVLVAFGLPMGPFAMADLAGLDLGWTPATSSGATVRDILCERGRRGQKTRCGFYDYDEARKATPHARGRRHHPRHRAPAGDRPARGNPTRKILERCLYPMINEGVKILDEKIARRASDIDVIWVNGYGWPAYRGGPMYYADSIGLDHLLARLAAFQATRGDAFAPSPLLERSRRRAHKPSGTSIDDPGLFAGGARLSRGGPRLRRRGLSRRAARQAGGRRGAHQGRYPELAPHPRAQGLGGAGLGGGRRRPRLDPRSSASSSPRNWPWPARCRSHPSASRCWRRCSGRSGRRPRRHASCRRRCRARSGGVRAFRSPAPAPTSPALSTRAIRDGDHYVVDGQKTWTTLAQHADWGFFLVRTDPSKTKQAGISFLLIDMTTPGVSVRPIITLDGGHEINEVWLDGVRVPVENRVFAENEGWTCAKYLLAQERTGIAGVARSKRALALLRRTTAGGLADDPIFRRKMTALEVDLLALGIYRAADAHPSRRTAPEKAPTRRS